MTTVYIKGKSVSLVNAKLIGKGGEADILDLGDFYGTGRPVVLKLYKCADHPDYAHNPHEQKGAENRLKTHQIKLKEFPRNMPPQVVAPIDLATDRSGKKIVGLTLDFLKGYELLVMLAESSYRQAFSIGDVVEVFKDLRNGVAAIHATDDTVIGDFNDLNIMFKDLKVRMIDADSFQYGQFTCNAFTAKFVDPRLCVPNPDPAFAGPMLAKPHDAMSDWYAFNIMLMQCLLLLDSGPYGGVFRPKNAKDRLKHSERWQHRVTVFHPEVIYPKPATHYRVLPDDLLDFWHKTFVKDQRGEFPAKLLDLYWSTCSCGTVHARASCPACQSIAVGRPTQITRIEGKVKVTVLFQGKYPILFATAQQGKIAYLYHDGQGYRREDGSLVMNGPLDPHMRYRIRGEETMVAKEGIMITLKGGQVLNKIAVDSFTNLPLIDANEHSRFWAAGGKLYRNDANGVLGFDYQEVIGSVLEGQTLFWVGPKFGFGFYRGGTLSIAFMFNAKNRGINDTLKVQVRGQLIDSTCAFSDKTCWFFYTSKIGSQIINHCHVLNDKGEEIASTTAEKGSEPWLDRIRGKCAFGENLFVATDEGLKRYGVKNGRIELTHEYADTEKVVDAGDNLFLTKDGMCVVSSHEVKLVQLT